MSPGIVLPYGFKRRSFLFNSSILTSVFISMFPSAIIDSLPNFLLLFLRYETFRYVELLLSLAARNQISRRSHFRIVKPRTAGRNTPTKQKPTGLASVH
jgi:hypothetical protein